MQHEQDDYMTEFYFCRNCGHHEGPDDASTASHCPHCPPWSCEQCGEINTTLNPCGCWTSLADMTPADVKALFADECGHRGINVNTDGSLQ